MNIFDQYGIKEVADVTLYSIQKKQDGSGDIYYVPALFLDTLKISSVEKTAENVWAEGGVGNARLISWDYGKQINVSLQDALCTPASLGLCWNGILSADWKDSHIQINSQSCNCQNEVDRIERMEKAFYPRNDRENGVISKLLPHLKRDEVSDDLDLLKISSIVDGTKIEGTGRVKCHGYRWRIAIESVVNSIAQVPDRFFDIKGRAYPIDINRKVSVHSLPTYDNYKDAIIYKINTKTKGAPPVAKIIFDQAMIEKGQLSKKSINVINQDKSSLTFAELWNKMGYLIHADGILESIDEIPSGDSETTTARTYYYPLRSLTSIVRNTGKTEGKYDYIYDEKLYLITDDDIIDKMSPEIIEAQSLTSDMITYNENHAMTDLCGKDGQISLDHEGSVEEVFVEKEICEADYLAIIVDNNNDYHALIGVYAEKDKNEPKDMVVWYKPKVPVDVSQFKGLDMWIRFQSINELIYFLITKYNNDIVSIFPATINANEGNDFWAVDDKITTVEEAEEYRKYEGKLWAYINPKTMRPYDDDYWFHQGEPYLIKSLTIAPKNKKLKANRMTINAGQWPGMYMLIGETWIRSYDTGKDERMQIKFPLCKVKSDHTISLEADGEPITFDIELEVAKPACGKMMEITTYEIATRMQEGEKGCFYAIDGSSEILSE